MNIGLGVRKPAKCTFCGEEGHYAYSCWRAPNKPVKTNKRPKQLGRRGLQYIQWRDEVARPHLDSLYGHVCSVEGCVEVLGLDVAHIAGRGSNPGLKMKLDNIRWLCRTHHSQEHLGG